MESHECKSSQSNIWGPTLIYINVWYKYDTMVHVTSSYQWVESCDKMKFATAFFKYLRTLAFTQKQSSRTHKCFAHEHQLTSVWYCTVLGINNSHINSSKHSYSQKESSSNNHYSHIPTVSDLWCTKGSVLDSRIFIIKVNSVLNLHLESWKQSTVYNSVIVESQSKPRLITGTLVAKFSVPSHVVLFTKIWLKYRGSLIS